MDVWHAVLAGALIVVVAMKLRASRKHHFKATVIIERDRTDEAESTRDRHKPE